MIIWSLSVVLCASLEFLAGANSKHCPCPSISSRLSPCCAAEPGALAPHASMQTENTGRSWCLLLKTPRHLSGQDSHGGGGNAIKSDSAVTVDEPGAESEGRS